MPRRVRVADRTSIGSLDEAGSETWSSSLSGAFRCAERLGIPQTLVSQCVLPGDRFERAWRHGLGGLDPRERRGRICVETGTIAESVATLLLVELGLDVFAELASAGVHGVDLLALTPGGQVLAVEVKGTLRLDGRPRLGRGRQRQMTLAWLDSPSNPAMVEWGLGGLEIYGSVAHLNFASMTLRVVLTHDYDRWMPVLSAEQLYDLSVLDSRRAAR
jgi:hypothetical protein